MSVAVYSRLGELLKDRNLTIAQLGDQITSRYGLVVDAESLRAWEGDAPVQRADLELAGAAAAILDVSLSDLFNVNAIPDLPEEVSILDAADTERLSELLDLQRSRQLSDVEATELAALIAEYGHRSVESSLDARARRCGISVEQARRELHEALDEAGRWLEAFEADPQRRRALVSKLRRRNRRLATPT